MSPTPQRTWLVTGVSSGLGRAIAEHALGQGDRVIGTFRQPGQSADFEGRAPGRSFAVQLDLADEADVPGAVLDAVERVGGSLDVLVNNAGYCLVGAVEESSPAEVRQIMATNFHGPVRLTQAVLPLLRRSCGHVVNVSSVAATIGYPWTAMYSASKAALTAWSDALAAELADLGVRVTCLEPGGFRTNFTGSSLRRVERSLPEYAEQVGATRRRYAAAGEHMPNDPRKAAAVIARLVGMEDPPVRLALGEDAHAYLGDALQRRIAEYARHRDLSADTAFEAATPSGT